MLISAHEGWLAKHNPQGHPTNEYLSTPAKPEQRDGRKFYHSSLLGQVLLSSTCCKRDFRYVLSLHKTGISCLRASPRKVYDFRCSKTPSADEGSVRSSVPVIKLETCSTIHSLRTMILPLPYPIKAIRNSSSTSMESVRLYHSKSISYWGRLVYL